MNFKSENDALIKMEIPRTIFVLNYVSTTKDFRLSPGKNGSYKNRREI